MSTTHLTSATRGHLAWVVALGLALGLAAAWLMPRGPVNTSQALISLGLALIAGVLAGALSRSRWAMLVLPVACTVAFELGRLRVSGPTVDAIQLSSAYGVIAFVVGRMVQFLLVVPPMMLGVFVGATLRTRFAAPTQPSAGWFGWTLAALVSGAIVALVVLLARPARTEPVAGPQGEPLPGSVAELVTIPIGGHDQALMLRGASADNPVLLYLAGGPGGTDLGAMRADVTLEQHFVVATWDQRGCGKSYGALEPAKTLTLSQMVADTLAVTQYLRERFGEDKICLVANSWGSLLGALAVQERPELYQAYVGCGQMVSPVETDLMFWEDTMAWAKATGNVALVQTLESKGKPPYDNLLDYVPGVFAHEHDWNAYPELDASKEMPFNLFVPENTVMDRINGMRGLLDTFSVLYPQIQDLDLRRDAPSLQVPVYLAQGVHEARGRDVLARAWFDQLEAPAKQWIEFEHSGHRPMFEEPVAFAQLMESVRDATYVATR